MTPRMKPSRESAGRHEKKFRRRSQIPVEPTSRSAEPFIAGASAVVLAGGKSSRMGRPKALLPFGDEPLIVHIIRALKRIFPEIVVVTAPGQDMPALPVKLVRDEVAYQGPVGGIYYGLKAAGGEFCFVTSCDVAFVNSALICYLASQILQHDVVVPYWQDRFQPLHAVYRRSVLPLLESQLERGELRPVYLFDRVRTHRVGEEEIRSFDPQGLSFFNMNTPADYQEALERWKKTVSSVICTVELFGAVRLLAKTREISLALPEGATLSDVYSALAANLPTLLGRVISPDRTNLVTGYACNINGLNFIRSPTTKVNSGDKIFILSADAGG
jgi:molybdopterin-guanine dinucleotide biosynthesis protein A